MFYTPEERDRISREAPTMMYAELAHKYPCCNLPTVTDCAVCSIDPEKCSNKAEVERARMGNEQRLCRLIRQLRLMALAHGRKPDANTLYDAAEWLQWLAGLTREQTEQR